MSSWRPTRIHRVIRKLGTSAETVIVETDAGEAYAKFPGSSEGEHFLAFEVIGTEAARFLGLRTFDTAIINNPHPGFVSLRSGELSKAGPVFVSRAEKGITWSGEAGDLESVANPRAISGILVLDTWLQNCDRYRDHGHPRKNLGNVFLSREVENRRRGKWELVAMDHTHIITCGSEMTQKINRINKMKELNLYGNFPGFRDHITTLDIRHFTGLLEQFGKDEARRILAQIPTEWLPSQGIQDALVEYLATRAGFIASNVGTMLSDAGWIDWQLEL